MIALMRACGRRRWWSW